MTPQPKPDWADTLSAQIYSDFKVEDNIVDGYANALRKAKADGMREAAEIYEPKQQPSILALDGVKSSFYRYIQLRADEIEQGQPLPPTIT